MITQLPCWLDSFQFSEPEKSEKQKGNLKTKGKAKPSTVVSKREAFNKKYSGYFYILGENTSEAYQKIIEDHALDFQKEVLEKLDKETLHFTGSQGYVWILKLKSSKSASHSNYFAESFYAQAREGAGGLVNIFKALQLKTLRLEFVGTTDEEEVGSLVGLEMGAYHFRSLNESKNPFEALPQVEVFYNYDVEGLATASSSTENMGAAKGIANSVNWARHWTNLPGNLLNPKTMADSLSQIFKKSKTVEVNIWNDQKLAQEKMGLHLAVGMGATHGPCMVHLKYRPVKKSAKTKSKQKVEAPLVFVGKGVTFDTGGLDLKPSSAMRLMKKDMGGAATVAALCMWVEQSEYPYPCDFYLGLAENAVSDKSMRPGDIYTAKNGLPIEIHNTDAEGRLVLADVLTAAIANSEVKPKYLIDVATLTGAIKVALGADLAGLFSNNDELADLIGEASHRTGDLCWRMPLFSKYASQMNSPVAAMTNAVDGFGGAITAALFLEKFVEDVPWAHLDIYAWNDKASGALSFTGGSGQGVQSLIGFLSLYETQQ